MPLPIRFHWTSFIWIAACCFWCHATLKADDKDNFFETRIRPLLIARCQECHGATKQEGGLRLDSRQAWQKGGENGSVIEPGSPDTSRLIEAVRFANADLQMPPSKKLAANEIADLEAWIAMGAFDPRDGTTDQSTKQNKPLWSLQPIAHVAVPTVADDRWSLNLLDRFILAEQRKAGLQPSPDTDRRTFIRRATMDLTGLMPTYDQVDEFVHDDSLDAYERLIDRLLASPQYGENWARHWLDVARYSDTKGYVYAREENRWVHAAAYRDWVVRSLNDDMPYDHFIRLQIAADQIVPANSPDLAAMGFLTIGRRFLGVTHDVIDDRIDVVSRGVLGMTVACTRCHDHKYDPIPTRDYYSLYGVFQSCEEKLVPIETSLDQAFQTELARRERIRDEGMAKRREEQAQRIRSKIDQYLFAQKELEKYPEEVFNQILEADDLNPFVVRKWQAFLAKDKLSPKPLFAKWHALDERADRTQIQAVAKDYLARFADIEKRWTEQLAKSPEFKSFEDHEEERLRQFLFGAESPCSIPNEHITNIEVYFPTDVIVELWKLQGEVDRWLLDNDKSPRYATVLVDRTTPSTPRVFTRGNPLTKGKEVSRHFLTALGGKEDQPFQRGSGRLELAQALTSPENPLTARVMVNRVWMHHFGRGLVNTPSDFGNRAEQPTHPELLDWLSRRFVESGWSLKSLHRWIMLSRTYLQGNDASSRQSDPDNRLVARMQSRRLSFEQARDAWLQSSGELDLRIGGKTMKLFDSKNKRRTLYSQIDRERVSPVLRVFDFANPDLSIPQRTETSVPQQALFAMNHPFVAQRAIQLNSSLLRVQKEVDTISKMYRAIYQRDPTSDEMQLAKQWIQAESLVCVLLRLPIEWTYGYGEYLPSIKRVVNFTELPHFNGTEWQGGESYPDSKLGWLKLTATGGHPGNDMKHAVIRRWTARDTGDYSIRSQIVHEPEAGDGIHAMILHSGRGVLESTKVHHAKDQMNVSSIRVWSGDTIDFIVDIGEGLNSDQFLWTATIERLQPNDGYQRSGTIWASDKDFTPPRENHLNAWQQFAQVLMLANEFMFYD